VKNGETTILQADLQNKRSKMDKREVEASQQIVSLQKSHNSSYLVFSFETVGSIKN
jgi:hypothetical protein